MTTNVQYLLICAYLIITTFLFSDYFYSHTWYFYSLLSIGIKKSTRQTHPFVMYTRNHHVASTAIYRQKTRRLDSSVSCHPSMQPSPPTLGTLHLHLEIDNPSAWQVRSGSALWASEPASLPSTVIHLCSHHPAPYRITIASTNNRPSPLELDLVKQPLPTRNSQPLSTAIPSLSVVATTYMLPQEHAVRSESKEHT